MIYHDPDEAEQVECPGNPCPGLEATTGADFMVTPSQLPAASPELISIHIKKFRAVLIQVKRGYDLSNSIGGRLLGSLARMREIGADKNQCLLVSCGVFLPDRDGYVRDVIPRKSEGGLPYVYASPIFSEPRMQMTSLSTALAEWALFGGGYVPLHDDYALSPFLERLERLLIQARDEPEKLLWPEVMRFEQAPDKPFREIKLVRDGRSLLAALPGIGPTKAQACADLWGSAADALPWLSDPDLYDKLPDSYPHGVGHKTVEKIRDFLGGTMQRAPAFADRVILAETSAERENND